MVIGRPVIASGLTEEQVKDHIIRTGTVPEQLLRELVRLIVEEIHPERILLFGSAARGRMRAGSDLDILVVKSGVHRRRTAQVLYSRLPDIPISKDILVAHPEDLESYRDDPGYIYGAILEEGRVLYSRPAPGAGGAPADA